MPRGRPPGRPGPGAVPAPDAPYIPGRGISVRASMRLVERHYRRYKAAWLPLAAGFLEPFCYLISIGFGLGGLIGRVPGPDGRAVSYAAFVAPGLLAAASMNGAISDATFSVFFRLKQSKLYEAVIATPVRPDDIALGDIIWTVLRSALYALAFLAFMLATELAHSAWSALVVLGAPLTAFAFAGAGLAAATFMRSLRDFDFVTALTMPMFVFSTSFYPLSVFPPAARLVVECTPLYQGVTLLRGLTLGGTGPLMLLHAGYLALMGLAGFAVAKRRIGQILLV